MLDVVEKRPNKITVACPDCNKIMAPKTLKYNHKHICPAKENRTCEK
ncbi:MAG: hypothetical protein ACKPKO_28955 [Candidatus Fonsibacter sp.]